MLHMKEFFKPNISRNGRLLRASMGAVLFVIGCLVISRVTWLGVVLLCSAVFVIFEALRGWCVMRACGIKTKI